MALKQNDNGKWVHDRWFGRVKRVRVTFPAHIRTREEAERYIPQIPPERFHGLQRYLKRPLKTLITNAIDYFRSVDDIDFHNNIEPFMEYCIAKEITGNDIINLTPNIIEHYSQARIIAVSPKKHNREIRAIAQLHSYMVNQGICSPIGFEIEKFFLRVKKEHDISFSEKFFELLIEKYPREFLNMNYKNIPAPLPLEGMFPDSLFEDDNGNYCVVEIQKGRLDRNHSYKILDYRDKMEGELKKVGINAQIDMMVILIGDECPPDREVFMRKYGIKFIKLHIPDIEKIILQILEKQRLRTSDENNNEMHRSVSTEVLSVIGNKQAITA